MRLEKDGTRTVLSRGIDGKRFDGPNDIIIKSDGAMYMTDSDWGLRDRHNSALKQLRYQGVFLIRTVSASCCSPRSNSAGPRPNGLALSPDEKIPVPECGSETEAL